MASNQKGVPSPIYVPVSDPGRGAGAFQRLIASGWRMRHPELLGNLQFDPLQEDGLISPSEWVTYHLDDHNHVLCQLPYMKRRRTEEGAPEDVAITPYQPYVVLRQSIIGGLSGDQVEKAKKYLKKDLATGYGVPVADVDKIKSATDLLDTLERCHLLSRHNSYFLIWLLQKCKADSLAKKVESYNKERQKVALEFFSATESAVEGGIFTEFAFREDISQLSGANVDRFRELLRNKLDQLKHHITLINVGAGDDCVILTFQIPRDTGLINHVRQSAKWLLDSGVFGVHMSDKSYMQFFTCKTRDHVSEVWIGATGVARDGTRVAYVAVWPLYN